MRKRHLLIPCALALFLGAALLPLACRPRPHVGPDWTPGRLAGELRRAGLDYEARPTGPLGAWCLRAPGNATPWEEIALGTPGHIFNRPGCVRVLLAPGGADPADDEGRLRLGPLFLLGHPADLARIAAAVGD
jgi:hypothetical protein